MDETQYRTIGFINILSSFNWNFNIRGKKGGI